MAPILSDVVDSFLPNMRRWRVNIGPFIYTITYWIEIIPLIVLMSRALAQLTHVLGQG